MGDRELRQRLGAAAAETAQNYAPEAVMPLWEDLFAALLSGERIDDDYWAARWPHAPPGNGSLFFVAALVIVFEDLLDDLAHHQAADHPGGAGRGYRPPAWAATVLVVLLVVAIAPVVAGVPVLGEAGQPAVELAGQSVRIAWPWLMVKRPMASPE